jgi:hypothetical protein
MLSLLVICNGVIRSGSTWSYNVCRLLAELRSKRRGEPFQSGYLDVDPLEQFLNGEAFLREGTVVAKAHAPGPTALEWIRTGRARAVCTIRDPRDCVASDVAFMGKGFDHSLHRVAASLKQLESAQNFGRTLFIRYEEMMNDRLAQIRLIAAHLNIRIDQRELEAIDEQTNIASSREQCGKVNSLREDQVSVVYGNHKLDKMTLLHSNHIGTTKVGRWRQDLTDAQCERVTRLFANVLLIFGYETQQSIQMYLGPSPGAGLPPGNYPPSSHPMC